jgi:hypothetical protein
MAQGPLKNTLEKPARLIAQFVARARALPIFLRVKNCFEQILWRKEAFENSSLYPE